MRTALAIAFLSFPVALVGQNNGVTASSIGWNGIQIEFVTKIDPGARPAGTLGGGVGPETDRTHRYITDPSHRIYFGYDVLVEPLSSPETVRLRFEPMSVKRYPDWALIPPPSFPVMPVVHVGDTVILDLLVNPTNGEKVVDYLTVTRPGVAMPAPPRRGAPRDFEQQDIELVLFRPRVFVNGKPFEHGQDNNGGITAHVLWIELGGIGDFLMSIAPEDPRLGFRKAGTVSGNTMTFESGGSEYRIEGASPIVPASGVFNVYVLANPGWVQYKGEKKMDFAFGGADKAEYMVKKR